MITFQSKRKTNNNYPSKADISFRHTVCFRALRGVVCFHLIILMFTFFLLDQDLIRMRTVFVERASREVINQLLDDLFEDGVLNDGEKDSVLEENRTRADKARCLIDLVRKKGQVASKKMVSYLQQRDPLLFSAMAQNI